MVLAILSKFGELHKCSTNRGEFRIFGDQDLATSRWWETNSREAHVGSILNKDPSTTAAGKDRNVSGDDRYSEMAKALTKHPWRMHMVTEKGLGLKKSALEIREER